MNCTRFPSRTLPGHEPIVPCPLWTPAHAINNNLHFLCSNCSNLGAASCFDTFWAQQKLCSQSRPSAEMFSRMKMKSLKENRIEMLQLTISLRAAQGGMCWNARLIKAACPTFAAQSDQFFCSLRHFWLFILSMFCVVLWPGLLLLLLVLLVVCRSLRYYFAIHFCLTQFQFQFQFQFQLPAFYYYLKKRNETKRNFAM